MRSTTWDHGDEGLALRGPHAYAQIAHANPWPSWTTLALGVVIVGLVGAGVYAVAVASDRPSLASSEDAAVAAAVQQLGSGASTVQIAQLAFAAAYPGQPVTEPAWASVVSKVETTLGRPAVPVKIPSGGEVPDDEAAELVSDWLITLEPGQVAAARSALGAGLADPLFAAAEGGDDVGARGALLAIKLAAAGDVRNMWAPLRAAVGEEKLQEFFEILDDTVGQPQINPAAITTWRSSA